MPGENPHLPEEKEPAPGGAPGSGEAGPVQAQQDRTLASSLLATFVPRAGEPPEQERDRFIDEVLIPALERGPLPEARDLITEMTEVLERGLPTLAQARQWIAHTETLVARTGQMLLDIQRATGGLLGPVGAFAMAEIAHRGPKYLHMVIRSGCFVIAEALARGETEKAQTGRKFILEHIGGMQPLPADERFMILLQKYSLTREDFQKYFRDAGEGMQAFGSFGAIHGQVERRFFRTIRDVLGIKQHEYTIDCNTNIPLDQETEEIVPRFGLIVEVLAELITNALKVMEQTGSGGKLVVSVILRKNGSLLLKVRDDGPGIGDKDPEALFAAGETTTQRFGGTGMGLTFLRQNIERHFQGYLTAQKNTEIDGGSGMTFSCILPPAGGWPRSSEDA
ncbi:MAG: ATP-binding protein [Candidatus Peribacter sp.]|nr:ATP-binding protein [Candidatus Peribacter sp.]